MIQCDAVHKRFPNGTTAVHDLTLDMPEGGVTALVGSSGCGKTTTLGMINRMVEPTSGTIKVGGKDVTDRDAAALRRSIGYVIQQSGLFPHRTVPDDIATVPLLLGHGRRKARARAAELLETVGLTAEAGKRHPHQLSGGQQLGPQAFKALGGGSASPAPSPPTRRCCSWTSRSARSTRWCAPSSRTNCCESRRS